MNPKRSLLLACAAATVSLAACSPLPPLKEGQYWQRVNVSESVYARGEKAQQMLERDIAHCVTELRELERLGVLKNTIETDVTGRVLDPDQKKLEEWDMPERDGVLFPEHKNFHDFESCMLAAGWERVEYLPYDISKRAREDYIQTHIDYRYRSRLEEQKRLPTSNEVGDFGDLNK